MATLWRTTKTPCQNTAIAATTPIQARKRMISLFPDNATCARATQ
jgi:hypothetical protein